MFRTIHHHFFFFFFNDTATTEIYTLSLHDALPISHFVLIGEASHGTHEFYRERAEITKRLIQEKGFSAVAVEDRKSTRLNSSHANISYAVFCLKKKKKNL